MNPTTHRDSFLLRWALYGTAGPAVLVGLHATGLLVEWSEALQETVAGAPFYLTSEAARLSPGAGFMICIMLSLLVGIDLLLMKQRRHRILSLIGILLLIVAAFPVVALWGVFLNSISLCLTATVTGLLCIVLPLPLEPEQPASPHD